MLPLIVLLGLIGIAVLIMGSVLFWLTGLLTAFLFVVVAILVLYAFHEMDVLNVEKDPWLLLTPFGAGALGLFLDRMEMLQIQALSLSSLLADPVGTAFSLSMTNILLFVIVGLLIVDVVVGRR